MDRKSIAKKWYQKLGFDEKYDEEFYTELKKGDLSALTVFPEYDYKNNTPVQNLLACLYFCEALEKEYEKRDICERILIDSLQDLVLWNDSYYEVHGKIGLTEFPWIDRNFLLQIFRLGRLQFCMFPSFKDIPEIGVKEGEPLIEVHIPKGKPLKEEDCLDSFAQAKAFFPKYFPDFPQEWCICFSWMLDESILPLLGENSNIAKFQKQFQIIWKTEADDAIRFTFPWDTTRENLAEREPKSGLARRIKERALAGGVFYETLGIRKL